MVRSPTSTKRMALLLCLLGGGSVAAADTPEQLLAIARDGNRAAIRSVQTMECRYARNAEPGTAPDQTCAFLFSGRFWRSGNTYRLLELHAPLEQRDTEYIYRDGKTLAIRKGGGAPPILSLTTPSSVHGTGGEMWQYLLFSHWGPQEASFFTFDEILQQKYVLKTCERLPSGEIHVVLSHARSPRQEYWFDPKFNYLVRRSVSVALDTNYHQQHEVIEFAEPIAGVFIPKTVETRCFFK